MNSTAQPDLDPQAPLPTGPTHVASRSTQTRASNAARAALVVSKVTPTGYRVGLFMANHARYAKPADVRRNVEPGEIFTYWPQAKVAAAMGCSERQVRRGVRSLREAGAIDVRRRVRPCEASYVWVQPVLSGVLSGGRSDVLSHTEPRKEPQSNHVRSSRARVVCENCKHDWPDGYGTYCKKCGHDPSTRTPTDEPKACTCGEAYRQSYGRRCIDCDGKPSAAQRDAVREQHGCGGVDNRVGADGGGSDNPSVPETDERAAAADPPRAAEPGPNEKQFNEDLAKWIGKRRPQGQHDDKTKNIEHGREAQRRRADYADQG